MSGDIPIGCTEFGMETDGNRIVFFGGLTEYTTYSNDLYELQISNWYWQKISPTTSGNIELPKPRFGHSFTLVGNKIFLFGGMTYDNDNFNSNKSK